MFTFLILLMDNELGVELFNRGYVHTADSAQTVLFTGTSGEVLCDHSFLN